MERDTYLKNFLPKSLPLSGEGAVLKRNEKIAKKIS